jgi:hypothetical protein
MIDSQKASTIEILGLSDIHYFNPTVQAAVLTKNLQDTISLAISPNTRVIFIAGDLCHQLVYLNSAELGFFMQFIMWLFELCKENSIYLRILRGTFSHDNNQLNQLRPISKRYGDLDGRPLIRVIDQIEVEELLSLNVLYKPDDVGSPRAFDILRLRLDDFKIQKADIFINHGYLEPLLPVGIPHVPDNTFSIEQLNQIVRGLTFNGHVHNREIFDRIINNGCFESTRFDEQGPKGMTKIVYNPNDHTYTHEFIINRGSTIFDEVVLNSKTDLDSLNDQLILFRDELLARPTTNTNIYVNIITDDKALFKTASTILKANGRIKTFKKALTKDKGASGAHRAHRLPELIITKDNFVKVVHQRINSDDVTEDFIKQALETKRRK